MKTLEMFHDYLANTIADPDGVSAGDIGSLIALAFMESGGDWARTIAALEHASEKLGGRPGIEQALEVMKHASGQIATGAWAED